MPSLSEALQTFSAVVITGGSSGIGKSFIERAGNLKPSLRFCNLSRHVPAINAAELNLCHVGCDLSDAAQIDRAAGEVEAWLKRDVPPGGVLLINNSGFGAYGPFPEPNLQHQLEMLDVNIRAVVHLTGRLQPALLERGGVVLNVASTAAFQPVPQMGVYAASKTFVLHWTLALNEEWRGTGLRAVAFCPGPTRTAFHRRAGLATEAPDPRRLSADEAVDVALAALGTRRSIVVPGLKNRLLAGLAGLAPRTLAAWIAGRLVSRYRLPHADR